MFGYRSILLTAVVTGVFATIVGVLLVIDGVDRLDKIPMEATEFVELRMQFVEQPNDPELRQQIQALDLALRQEYFREQRFTEVGSYLLLVGIMITLIFGKWAATLHRRLPLPSPKEPGPDSDELLSRRGLWAVAVVILALGSTTLAMNKHYRSGLPATLEELAALRNPSGDAGVPGEDAVVDSVIPDLPGSEAMQENWPNFRGPHGAGISTHQDVPTKWDGETGEGILWKTAVPLPGVNSPVVWKDRVFLSGATKDAREVYCFDATSGSVLWNTEIAVDPLVATKDIKTTDDTGYAAPSMATDGRFVFAMFADGLVVALDFSGTERWRRSLGAPLRNSYGHASSLVTLEGSLIVQYDQGARDDELSKLMSFDGVTGEPNWETVRATPTSWASPVVIENEGVAQIITCADPWVIAYAPDDGAEIWRAKTLDRVEVGPSPVFTDGIVYAGNDTAVFAAIRADGTGDVTDSHVQWTADYGLPDTCSPLVTDEFVLTLASYGTLFCFDKKEGGEPLWEEDLGADFYSSPSLVGNHVYLFSKEGTAWIVEPTSEECKRISEADLGEACVTSPAFQDGRIFIRGSEHLFCIGSANSDDN